jgi:hypothetical protein
MRQSGNTTRLVNAAVEMLFTQGIILVPKNIHHSYTIFERDLLRGFNRILTPFIDGETTSQQRHFVTTLLRRLEVEHPGQFEYDGKYLSLSNYKKEHEEKQFKSFIESFEAGITKKLENAPKHIQERIEAVVIVQKDEKSLKVEEQLKKFHNMMNDLEKEF